MTRYEMRMMENMRKRIEELENEKRAREREKCTVSVSVHGEGTCSQFWTAEVPVATAKQVRALLERE